MNLFKLNSAISEAETFIAHAKELKQKHMDVNGCRNHFDTRFPKERGFVKRKSMDCSRALASLRKPG